MSYARKSISRVSNIYSGNATNKAVRGEDGVAGGIDYSQRINRSYNNDYENYAANGQSTATNIYDYERTRRSRLSQQQQQQATEKRTHKTPSPRRMHVPPPIFDSDNEMEMEDFQYGSYKTSPTLAPRRSINTTSNFNSTMRANRWTNNDPMTRSVSATSRNSTGEWSRYLKQLSFKSANYIKQILKSYITICFGLTVALALAYFYANNATNSGNIDSVKYTPCHEIAELGAIIEPCYNCIESNKLQKTMELKRELMELLQTKAQRHYCLDPSQPATVKILELMKYLHKKGIPVDMFQLQALEYLLKQNPRWNIEITNAQGGPGTLSNRLGKPILNEELNFSLQKPSLPFKCMLRIKMKRFFVIVGLATLIGVSFLLCYVIFGFVRSRHSERYVAIDNFIKEIIEELSNQPDEEIIINHLRDELIPLNQRKALLWSWNEALRVLELSDSRIQFDMHLRNGEEFRTMRWIGNTITDALNASKNKSRSQSS